MILPFSKMKCFESEELFSNVLSIRSIVKSLDQVLKTRHNDCEFLELSDYVSEVSSLNGQLCAGLNIRDAFDLFEYENGKFVLSAGKIPNSLYSFDLSIDGSTLPENAYDNVLENLQSISSVNLSVAGLASGFNSAFKNCKRLEKANLWIDEKQLLSDETFLSSGFAGCNSLKVISCCNESISANDTIFSSNEELKTTVNKLFGKNKSAYPLSAKLSFIDSGFNLSNAVAYDLDNYCVLSSEKNRILLSTSENVAETVVPNEWYYYKTNGIRKINSFSGKHGNQELTAVSFKQQQTDISVLRDSFLGNDNIVLVSADNLDDWLFKIVFANEYANPMFYSRSLYVDGDEVKELSIINEELKDIGDYKFVNGDNISSVFLNTSRITDKTFFNCSNIRTLSCESFYDIEKLRANNDLSRLTALYFNDNVADNACLSDLISLQTIRSKKRNAGYYYFSDYQFANCKSLIAPPFYLNEETGEYIEFTKELKPHLFDGCYSIDFQTTDENAFNVSEYAFNECSSMTHFPKAYAKNVGACAFKECEALTSIAFSATQTIGEEAFSGCKSLKTIDLSNTEVSKIEKETFKDCIALETIVLPNGIKSIEERAFANCVSLRSIEIPCKNDSSVLIAPDAFAGDVSLSVVFSERTLEELKSMPGYPWGLTDDSIFTDKTVVGDFVFVKDVLTRPSNAGVNKAELDIPSSYICTGQDDDVIEIDELENYFSGNTFLVTDSVSSLTVLADPNENGELSAWEILDEQ